MKFLTNLSLGKKIALLTTIGLILGGGIFSSVALRAVNQATETMLQDRLTTAHLVADYVDGALELALSELKLVSLGITGDLSDQDLQYRIEALEGRFHRLSIFVNTTYLLDRQGQVVWSKPGIPVTQGIDMSSYDSVNQALTQGVSTISGLVSSPLIDDPVVFLVSPAIHERSGDHGAIVVSIDVALSSIGGFIRPIRLGKTGYVEVVDKNGVVITRTDPGPVLSPFEKSDHSGRFAALMSAGEATRGVCHTCHETKQKVERRDVLAFVPLTIAPWGVVIRQSEDEALTPIHELRRNLILFGLGLVAIALLLVVIITRDIGGRIRILTTASRKIAEGDLISPVITLGSDEVGTLANTLDDMRLKLKTSYGELEQRTNELSSLLSVSEILTSIPKLPQLLEAVVVKAVEVIPGASSGILLLKEKDRDNVSLQCAVGLDKQALSEILDEVNSNLDTTAGTQNAVRENKVSNIVTALMQSDFIRSQVKGNIRAEVYQRGEHMGCLLMINTDDKETFSDSDQRLLQAIADYTGIAIERAQLAKEAEEARALHEADRLRAQFISSVSHELRTPLTLIKGYTTSLLRQNVNWDKETQEDFLQIIDGKTDELRDLIDQLLQSAKLEAGALKLDKEPILVPRLTKKIIEEISHRAPKHNFILEFADNFPVVEADTRCIEQVIRNLLQNAAKYSPDGGNINISGEIENNKIIVNIKDEGIGIPAEHLEKIFERFYRLQDPQTHDTSGTGLGLSIVRGHIEAHGGELWVESKVGKGSTFYFSLPLEQSDDD